jgi:bifunctional enzyme CysN/CysC
LEHLEAVDVSEAADESQMRMAIQWVNRPHSDFRGFSGPVLSGKICRGDKIVVASSGRETRVERIVTIDGEAPCAEAGDEVTILFSDEVDVSRGDVLCRPDERPCVAGQFAAHLIWLGEDQLFPGRPYLLKINGRTLPATVTAIKHKLDVETLSKIATKTLALNDIGFCEIAASAPVVFDAYEQNKNTGAFILIDRFTNATVAGGMISFPLRRAANIHPQGLTVSKAARSSIKRQKPAILWFTGLSGAGKSTIANLVEAKLYAWRAHTMLLDGDNIRHGLNKDLGFTEADRVENIRRIGEVAKLMTEAGLIVLCSFISPFKAERLFVRELAADGEFIEIFIDAPLDVCITRDPKGLYKRALSGAIKNFTGLDQPYEPPENPELHFASAERSADEIADDIVRYLAEKSIVES